MSTEAARDDRLTPQAKALLQIIRARCGHGRITRTTKSTLGRIVRRSARSVQRYLVDLRRCGYIETKHRTNAEGMDTGLVIRVLDAALPFFQRSAELGTWLMGTGRAEIVSSTEARVFAGETSLSSINDLQNESSLERALGRLGRLVMETPPGLEHLQLS